MHDTNCARLNPSPFLHRRKSATIAALLALLFGPLGVFYATWRGGLAMIAVNLVASVLFGAPGLLIGFFGGVGWALVAVANHNQALDEQLRRLAP